MPIRLRNLWETVRRVHYKNENQIQLLLLLNEYSMISPRRRRVEFMPWLFKKSVTHPLQAKANFFACCHVD